MFHIFVVLLGLILITVVQEGIAVAESRLDGKTVLAGDLSPPGKEMVRKKRSGPEPVSPVVFAGVRYEVVHWGKGRGLPQNGGYIAAIDEASDKELWLLRVYEVHYDDDIEDDKRDIFITSLVAGGDGKHLYVEDERGRRYVVDTATRKVSSP